MGVSEYAPNETKELWQRHGLSSTDRYLNIDLVSISALIEYAAETYPGQIAFFYPVSSEIHTSYETLSWDQFHRMINKVAAEYSHVLRTIIIKAIEEVVQPTVALLGHGSTIEYYTTQMALQKLNVRVLLLADKNSPEQKRVLVERCGVKALIVENDTFSLDDCPIMRLYMPQDCLRYADTTDSTLPNLIYEDGQDPWERPAFVIHSSGSTGPQKPIIHTNRSLMTMARIYRLFPDFHIDNWFLMFPLYGITSMCILPSGYPYNLPTTFPPRTYPPSAASILAAFKTLSAMGYPTDCFHSTPNHIENLYNHIQSTTHDFTPLSDLKVLQPGGALLSPSVISTLVNAGVNVKQTYGSTELGPLMRTFPHNLSNPGTEPLRLLYPGDPNLEMEPIGNGLFELIVHKGFAAAAQLWGPNTHTNLKDDEPYRTNDLFQEVGEPGSGDYVLQGRRDDVFAGANGLNIAAGAIEMKIKSESDVVANCLLVGKGRARTGLLVDVGLGRAGGGREDETEMVEKVWEAVEKVNRGLTDWERVSREMLLILPKERNLPVTVKGNVKRKEAMEVFEKEIEGLYE